MYLKALNKNPTKVFWPIMSKANLPTHCFWTQNLFSFWQKICWELHLTFLSGELAIFSMLTQGYPRRKGRRLPESLSASRSSRSLGRCWMLIVTRTVLHPNSCTSDRFLPVSPSGLQLYRTRFAIFTTTKLFLLWEVKHIVWQHMPEPAP